MREKGRHPKEGQGHRGVYIPMGHLLLRYRAQVPFFIRAPSPVMGFCCIVVGLQVPLRLSGRSCDGPYLISGKGQCKKKTGTRKPSLE